jgi:hypothetical protein
MSTLPAQAFSASRPMNGAASAAPAVEIRT